MTHPLAADAPFIRDDRETPRFRVHRRALVDPDVLQAERRNIFDKVWLYVGHESEIPNVHDFKTRSVGGKPIIMARDSDGQVGVFVNSCPHRGLEVETRPEGNARFLKCFYHGWSFDTSGTLVALRDDEAYGPNFDRGNLCLPRPASIGSYRGFVFLTWNPEAPSLDDYLGHSRTALDLVADQSEQGMSVVGGTHLYSMRANWKLLVENSFDAYHALTTHKRYVDMLRASGRQFVPDPKVPGAVGIHRIGPIDLGNGHAVTLSEDRSEGDVLGGLGRSFPDDESRAAHKARRTRLVERYGEAWTNRILGGRNHLIFPNTFVIDLVMGITIRTFNPISPDYMEVSAWHLVPEDEDERLRRMRMSNFLTFWGPAGLATPDDVEALERCQSAFAAHDVAPWNDISRGMNGNPVNSEAQMRVFWRHWNELVTGEHLEGEPTIAFNQERDGRPAVSVSSGLAR